MAHGRFPRNAETHAKVVKASIEFSEKLVDLGVKHALIGGLAVSKYGYARYTDDADFLLTGDSKYQIAGDPLGGEVEGKVIVFKGVEIDLLFPKDHQYFLEEAIFNARPVGDSLVPVIPQEALIYLKLFAARARDNGDVVELLKRGRLRKDRVIAYLEKYASELVDDFNSLALQAEVEPD